MMRERGGAITVLVDACGVGSASLTAAITAIQAHSGGRAVLLRMAADEDVTDALPPGFQLRHWGGDAAPDWADRLAWLAEAAADSPACVLAPGLRLTAGSLDVLAALCADNAGRTVFSLPCFPGLNPLALLRGCAPPGAPADLAQALTAALRPGLCEGFQFVPRLDADLRAHLDDAAALRTLGPDGLLAAAKPLGLTLTIAPHQILADGDHPVHLSGDDEGVETLSASTAIRACWPAAMERRGGIMLKRRKPRLLHLVHGWGGGSRAWIRLFGATDDHHDNLVLESCCGGYRSNRDFFLSPPQGESSARRRHSLTVPISEIALDHDEYRQMLREIIAGQHIDGLVVSSLIGHSLECLETGLPTTMVLHDFFPYCVGLNLSFGEVCKPPCDEVMLRRCLSANPHSVHFRLRPVEDWLMVRERWLRAILSGPVNLVAPSAFVRDQMEAHVPELRGRIHMINHASGMVKDRLSAPWRGDRAKEPFRIMLLGALAPHKGASLFERIVEAADPACEFHLLGCGQDAADRWGGRPNVKAVPTYSHGDLPRMVADIRPHLGLLLSMVPETFSFTLSELQQMSVPVLATALGAQGQRVADSGGGLALPARAADFMEAIGSLMASPDRLAVMAEAAARCRNPTGAEMHRAYRRIMGIGYGEGHPTLLPLSIK